MGDLVCTIAPPIRPPRSHPSASNVPAGTVPLNGATGVPVDEHLDGAPSGRALLELAIVVLRVGLDLIKDPDGPSDKLPATS